MADDAGALLVRSGLVSTSALDEARARVASSGGTVGEHLVASRVIEDDVLTDFYRSRLLVPQVNPNMLARLTPKVIAALPSDMAIELRAIPVSLDGENNLTVAMSDPSDRHAVDEIAFFTGCYVVRAVATQMQIAWCLAHYYGHVSELGHRLLHPSEPAEPSTVAPADAAVATTMPRGKGMTAKVAAQRHRAVAPITGPLDLPRPRSGEIAIVVAADEPVELPAGVPVEPAAPPPTEAATEAPTRTPTEPLRAESNSELTDGVPDQPRARSISGEIRVPGRQRAASIKPAPPDEDSDPVIVVSSEEADTGPRQAPARRFKAKTDPPELAARAGELSINSGPLRAVDDEPRVVIADEVLDPVVDASGEFSAVAHRNDTAPPTSTIEISVEPDDTGGESGAAVIHDHPAGRESQPILLDRPRGSEQAAAVPESIEDATTDDVVMLADKKPRVPRPEKHTQVGIAPVRATTRSARDTDVQLGVPVQIDDDPTSVTTAGAEQDTAAPQAGSDEETAKRPRAGRIDYDALDDGWGPPGTTIPPPLLGAMPGSEREAAPGLIPIASVDSAPLIMAPPVPPSFGDPKGHDLVRALEDATARSIDLIRRLEYARDRDEVVTVMVAHLAEAHGRAGFFVIKAAELSPFALVPKPATMPFATLRLDRPSTFQDVVGTRLPYRGPTVDDASRTFLAAMLGAAPSEILLVPVAVRERVVGVLFGVDRLRHTFDDQLSLASRAAGMALERILKSKRA